MITIANRQISLSPSQIWKQGGEAEIYKLGNSALKVYKKSDHPHFLTQQERDGAKARIQEHQTKLPAFPTNAPKGVVSPTKLAYDGNRIVGYTMSLISNVEPLMRYSEKSYQKSNNDVMAIFRNLHTLVLATHKAGIVIGDFNDLNVLVNRDNVYLIDADSFQFGKFLCKMFTTIFVDPLLCDPLAKKLELTQPHNETSDWYAFAVMLMRSLLLVGPYGGVYRPKQPVKRVTEPERPLHRLTVFNADTRYPKPAVPLNVLPDDLLHLFQQVFEHDQRGVFPELQIRWTACLKCGMEHARQVCPVCLPSKIVQTTVIKGNITCVSVFKTTGTIVFTQMCNDKLLYLYRTDKLYREDRSVVEENTKIRRYRLMDNVTCVGYSGGVRSVFKTQTTLRNTDNYDLLPTFDTNSNCLFVASGGRLVRIKSTQFDEFVEEHIGDVLKHKTLFWVGENFGFGFYQAGRMTVGFVFDAERKGINDTVKIPLIRGQLLDSTCFFASERCWFILSINEGGVRFNRCLVINKNGAIEAQAEAEHNAGTWLSTLRGKLATGKTLLCATDDGITKVEMSGGDIIEVAEYPTTFVDSSSHLFPSKDGIYVVSEKEINLISM